MDAVHKKTKIYAIITYEMMMLYIENAIIFTKLVLGMVWVSIHSRLGGEPCRLWALVHAAARHSVQFTHSNNIIVTSISFRDFAFTVWMRTFRLFRMPFFRELLTLLAGIPIGLYRPILLSERNRKSIFQSVTGPISFQFPHDFFNRCHVFSLVIPIKFEEHTLRCTALKERLTYVGMNQRTSVSRRAHTILTPYLNYFKVI